MFRHTFCIFFFAIVTVEVFAQKKTDRTVIMPAQVEGVIQEAPQQYTHVDKRRKCRLTLDLYRPAKINIPCPAIVMFYGGGWRVI